MKDKKLKKKIMGRVINWLIQLTLTKGTNKYRSACFPKNLNILIILIVLKNLHFMQKLKPEQYLCTCRNLSEDDIGYLDLYCLWVFSEWELGHAVGRCVTAFSWHPEVSHARDDTYDKTKKPNQATPNNRTNQTNHKQKQELQTTKTNKKQQKQTAWFKEK